MFDVDKLSDEEIEAGAVKSSALIKKLTAEKGAGYIKLLLIAISIREGVRAAKDKKIADELAIQGVGILAILSVLNGHDSQQMLADADELIKIAREEVAAFKQSKGE